MVEESKFENSKSDDFASSLLPEEEKKIEEVKHPAPDDNSQVVDRFELMGLKDNLL